MRIFDANQTFPVCAGEHELPEAVLECPHRSSCANYHNYLKAQSGKILAGRFAEYRPDLINESYCHYPESNPQP